MKNISNVPNVIIKPNLNYSLPNMLEGLFTFVCFVVVMSSSVLISTSTALVSNGITSAVLVVTLILIFTLGTNLQWLIGLTRSPITLPALLSMSSSLPSSSSPGNQHLIFNISIFDRDKICVAFGNFNTAESSCSLLTRETR